MWILWKHNIIYIVTYTYILQFYNIISYESKIYTNTHTTQSLFIEMPSNNVSCLLRYIILYWGHDSKSILCKSPSLSQESEPVAQRKHNTSTNVNVSAWWLPRTKRKKELQMQIRNLSLTILVLYIELYKYSTSFQNQQTTYLTFIKIQLFTMIHPTHESQPFVDTPKNPHRCPSKWRYLNLDLQREERHHSAVDRQAPTLVEENHLKQQKRPSRGIRLSHPPELDLTYTKNGSFLSRSPPFRKPSFWMLVFGDVIPWRVL